MKLQDGSTAVLRLVHRDNLGVYLQRRALHAPNHVPADGLAWRATHRSDIQAVRAATPVRVGPGGTLLDYVPFYFGARSPMLLQLNTGRVPGYSEGQAPLVYLVASAEQLAAGGARFVFFDGHALSALLVGYADLAELSRLDWPAIEARPWNRVAEDPDRQRRKEAEFLVYQRLALSGIRGLVVYDGHAHERVATLLAAAGVDLPIVVQPAWYY